MIPQPGGEVQSKHDPPPTRRRIAEHEAAHLIVAMAAGAVPLFAHVGRTLGGTDLAGGAHAHDDGNFMSYGPITTAMAVAGMVHDREDRIGLVDALMLFQCMAVMPQIGP